MPWPGRDVSVTSRRSWPSTSTRPSVGATIAICFRKGEHAFNYFSTVTTLGTPQDVTLQELRIECFFPADAATEDRARALR